VFPLVGPIAWFLAGRQRPAGHAGRSRRAPGARGGPRRPPAPDDDPEFLESLAERSRRQDDELFHRWEEDLRRREDDLRRREGDPPREENRPEV
ncbi:PLDc_N domain-containing protein, partial [Micromonospora sp. KC207]|uniref:PLD nuclease N-terminal domain-containing protein n=1 Tax=Micromonospora sp. KC207 TaxID=2530377 RepID=UPI00104B657C